MITDSDIPNEKVRPIIADFFALLDRSMAEHEAVWDQAEIKFRANVTSALELFDKRLKEVLD